MKTLPTNRHRLVWLALLVAVVATLAAPVLARQTVTSHREPAKIAVNWNTRAPRP